MSITWLFPKIALQYLKNQTNYIICAVISTSFFFFIYACISYQKRSIYIWYIQPPPQKIISSTSSVMDKLTIFLHILDDFKKKTNQFSQSSKMWTNREICYKNLYTFISHSIFDAKASKFIKQGVQKLLPSHSHINTIKFLT